MRRTLGDLDRVDASIVAHAAGQRAYAAFLAGQSDRYWRLRGVEIYAEERARLAPERSGVTLRRPKPARRRRSAKIAGSSSRRGGRYVS